MFCKNCGKELAESAKFCTKCGTKLEVKRETKEEVKQQPPVEKTEKEAKALVKETKGSIKAENLQKDEVVIMEAGIQWASLLPHVVLCFPTAFIWIIVLIYAAICRGRTKLTLTNKRLVGKVGGLFSDDFIDLPLNKVSSISVENSLLGKLLGYGDIRVGSSSDATCFGYLKNCNEFRNAVNAQIEIYEEERIMKQAAEMARAIK